MIKKKWNYLLEKKVRERERERERERKCRRVFKDNLEHCFSLKTFRLKVLASLRQKGLSSDLRRDSQAVRDKVLGNFRSAPQ